MEREAIQPRKRIAAALCKKNLTVRDTGAVLGISYQRAHQLVA
jgi:Trp operon repressor